MKFKNYAKPVIELTRKQLKRLTFKEVTPNIAASQGLVVPTTSAASKELLHR